jgi:TPR repeat protein
VNWYRRAADGLRRLAEAGNGQAMYVLGVMNAFGRGVAKDREQARRWLTQAVNYQVAAARPVLARLEKYREPEPKAGAPRDTKPTDARQTDARQTYVKPRDAEPSLQANVQVQGFRHEN